MSHQHRKKIREELRRMVDGELQLRAIGEVVERLTTGWELVRDPRTGTSDWQPLDQQRVSALAKALDVHMKLLGKVLPDLKAVEVSGTDGERLEAGTSDRLVLATKLLRIWREEQDSVHAFLE